MMTNTKIEIISSRQLFCILFVSRISALLIAGEISVFGFLFELFLSLFLGAAAVFAAQKSGGGLFFCKFFIVIQKAVSCLLGAAAVYSVFSFKDAEIPYFLFDPFAFLLIAVCVIYAASLGMESAARVSFLCAGVLVLTVLCGVFTNLKNVTFKTDVNIPFWGISPLDAFKCLDTPVLFLSFHPHIKNGEKSKKALFFSVFASYSSVLVLYSMCFLVLKNAVKIYDYPVFALFQLGEIGRYNKLDIAFTVPLLSAVFVKLSALFARCKG